MMHFASVFQVIRYNGVNVGECQRVISANNIFRRDAVLVLFHDDVHRYAHVPHAHHAMLIHSERRLDCLKRQIISYSAHRLSPRPCFPGNCTRNVCRNAIVDESINDERVFS